MCALHVHVRVLIDGNDDDGPLNGAAVASTYARVLQRLLAIKSDDGETT